MKRETRLLHDGISRERLGNLVELFYEELASRHGWARRYQANRNGHAGLLAWANRFLPEHFAKPASKLHQWLGRHLDKMTQVRGAKLNVLGPRGSGAERAAAISRGSRGEGRGSREEGEKVKRQRPESKSKGREPEVRGQRPEVRGQGPRRYGRGPASPRSCAM